ncbi:MAG TPA: hypothetical protein VHP31_11780 [Caproicibacter sp.]|nr:hypothetical protein [Caproicibacter sp.]
MSRLFEKSGHNAANGRNTWRQTAGYCPRKRMIFFPLSDFQQFTLVAVSAELVDTMDTVA